MASDDMKNVAATVYAASWFDDSLAVCTDEVSLCHIKRDEKESVIPLLPDSDITLQHLYLPMEKLLTRSFSLPLSHPRFLEADMLGQELIEMTGEDPSDWWLTWHAVADEKGVSGMLFGLSKEMRRAISDDDSWNTCPQLRVDGWERLSYLIPDDASSCAVIDADQEGVFIGYYHDAVWQGMRRLNWQVTNDCALCDEDMADHIMRSWLAMGLDAEIDAVVGYAGVSLSHILKENITKYQVVEETNLLDRHAANLKMCHGSNKPLINFRHGRWSVRSKMLSLTPWYRSMAMLGLLLLAWIGSLMSDITSLENKAEYYSLNIEQAFHRGLPNEKVMLDPLGQLKISVQGSGGGEDTQYFFRQLQAISSLYKNDGWKLRELEYKNGKMLLSGTANHLDVMNVFKDNLQKKVTPTITLNDTDISGKKVTFRMSW